MKRKYREAMRAALRERDERQDDVDDEAIEARDWHDEWAKTPHQQDEPNNYRSQK